MLRAAFLSLLLVCLFLNGVHGASLPGRRRSQPVQVDNVPYSGSSNGVGNDECHVSGAAKYIRAVITHTKADADAIPTTQDVARDEGPPGFLVRTASNRKQLVLSSIVGPQAIFGGPLYKDQQPTYAVINSTTVRADYTIEAGLLNGTLPLTTARIEEYFSYPDAQSCLMNYIQAIFYIGQK